MSHPLPPSWGRDYPSAIRRYVGPAPVTTVPWFTVLPLPEE